MSFLFYMRKMGGYGVVRLSDLPKLVYYVNCETSPYSSLLDWNPALKHPAA